MLPKRRAGSISRRTTRRALVVAGCFVGVFAPAAAQAATLGVETSLSGAAVVTVGTGGNGQLTVTRPAGSSPTSEFTLGKLTLIPSCGGSDGGGCPSGADNGVIVIGAATGSGACPGTFGVSADASGKVTFDWPSAIVLRADSPTCSVAFTYIVDRMATMDSNQLALDGRQTDLVAYAETTGAPFGAGSGYDRVTVQRATPLLTAEPTSRNAQVGGVLSVAGHLVGTRPNGSIKFELFGPGETCSGPPKYSSTVAVSGNGTYASSGIVAAETGLYHWKASYAGDEPIEGGDEDNRAVSSDCNDPAATTRVSAATTPPPPSSTSVVGTTNPGGGSSPGAGSTGGGPLAGKTTPASGNAKRVRLDAFALTRRTFARATTSTALAGTAAAYAPKTKKKAAKKGTTIKYTLSAPATVTIVVERLVKGRRAGGYANKCVKATRKLRTRKACTLYVKVSTLKRTYKTAGAKKVAFSGRAGRKAMAVGSYRLRATAAAGAGTTSAERKATFKIVKR